MIRFSLLALAVFLSFCSGSTQRKSPSESNKPDSNYARIVEIKPIPLSPNGLLPELKGDWISTNFTDSIFIHKQILQWQNVFYGDLLISIDKSDTLILSGHMDRGPIAFTALDSVSFKLSPEWGSTFYTFSRENDALLLGNKPHSRAFKRLNDLELKKTIRDEKAFMDYVVERLFADDYVPQDLKSRIVYISMGVETYTPFTFDAVGIQNELGETEYYGWNFNGDTLELFATTVEYDDDSGFASYEIGELVKKYYSNN